MYFFFSSRRRHTRLQGDWSSDVCSSDLPRPPGNHAHESASMRARALRVVVATVACLLWLNGCESSTRLGDMFQSNTAATPGASQDEPAITGSMPPKPREGASAAAAPRSSDANDDVSLGKK